MRKKVQTWLPIMAVFAMMLSLIGCGGSDGSAGPPGKDVDPALVNSLTQQVQALTQAVNPETCVTCHKGATPVARSGPMHQARYKEFYQDGVIKVSNIAIATNGVDTTTLTFKMTKSGANFDCRDADSIGSYYDPYDRATKRFTYPGPSIMSLKPGAADGTIAYDGAGGCTYTKKFSSATDKALVAKLATSDGVVQIYGVDEILETNPAKHMNNGKYPFAGVLKIGTVDYTSAANVSGCEGCHTQPFLKHAYIYGKVTDNAGAVTEFYTCKGCHSDARDGGHEFWQILKDDPARAAQVNAGSAVTAAEKTKYAYKTRLMNDVHMSHAMEFAYPQSMRNCVQCHAGKLDIVLADDKFKAETCVSCHSVDGIKAKMKAASYNHSSVVDALTTTDCTVCHKTNGAAPTFKTIHVGGYDPKIYTSSGVRYSDTFKVTINSASKSGNILTIKFSATGTLGSLSASNIKPTILIGLYGYDSKDFLVAAHGSAADGKRNLEYYWGDGNPRFTPVSAAGGSWEVKADLSLWADKIKDGSIKRAEIAVLPELGHPTMTEKNRAGQTVPTPLGLNAPSRTFDLTKNAFDDTYFKDIVKVFKTTGAGGVTGCNTCHDQLATTFHTGIRGGNIKVCRICHEVSNGGFHLELQSRSIDSYVHAIHQFQDFDIGNLNLKDPVQAMEHEHHIETDFPRFGIENCESCHNTGMYDVPDQAKSMPGVLSGSAAVAGRNIGSIPPTVTGPAVRACGACHRAQAINEDNASRLATQTQHWKTFGYVIETTSADSRALWETVVAKVMALFK